MVLIGAGQGLAFAPMTSAGLAGVDGADAGAASGMVNTFHQIGSALGLGVLASVSAARSTLVDRVDSALTGSSVLLGIALAIVVVLIACAPRGRQRPHHTAAAAPQPASITR